MTNFTWKCAYFYKGLFSKETITKWYVYILFDIMHMFDTVNTHVCFCVLLLLLNQAYVKDKHTNTTQTSTKTKNINLLEKVNVSKYFIERLNDIQKHNVIANIVLLSYHHLDRTGV